MQDLTTLFDSIRANIPEDIQVEPVTSFHEYALKQCEWYNESSGTLDEVNCQHCKNRGYFQSLDEDDNKIMKECKCMSTRRFIRAMNAAGLGDMYQKCLFKNYIVKEEWQRVCKETSIKFAQQDGNGWFYFAGNAGSGKTHLCTAICIELARRGREIKYVQWKPLYDKLIQTRFKEIEQGEIMRGLETVDVLYLDDFLKMPRNTQPKEEMLSYALEIVDARYKAGRKTIFSSEFPISAVNQFDEALGSRIYEMTKEYQISTGTDRKRNFRTGGNI